MRITNKQLRKIIREEIRRVKEAFSSGRPGGYEAYRDQSRKADQEVAELAQELMGYPGIDHEGHAELAARNLVNRMGIAKRWRAGTEEERKRWIKQALSL